MLLQCHTTSCNRMPRCLARLKVKLEDVDKMHVGQAKPFASDFQGLFCLK